MYALFREIFREEEALARPQICKLLIEAKADAAAETMCVDRVPRARAFFQLTPCFAATARLPSVSPLNARTKMKTSSRIYSAYGRRNEQQRWRR
jgi:hypothetical protein